MRLFRHIFLLLTAVMLATGCADEDRQAEDACPDGYGRLAITISTPEAAQTRAVDTTTPWLEGEPVERAIKSYCLLVCDENYNIVYAVIGGTITLGNHVADLNNNLNNYYLSTQTITTDLIPLGTYNFTFYCLANFTTDMLAATGLTLNSNNQNGDYQVTNTTLPTGFERKVMQPITNGTEAVPSTGLPMTGKLTLSDFTITKGTNTIPDPLILWRMMAKLEFQFFNESNSTVRIKGIEVDPINKATAAKGSGVYLISQDNLSSTNDLAAQFVNDPVDETGLTTTWGLHDATMETEAVESTPGLFAQTQLSWGWKLQSSGSITAQDAASTKLQKFKAKEKVFDQDEGAAIILQVKPMNGLTFTPTHLSFKACKTGTDSGKFNVVVISNGASTSVATNEEAARNNVSPYISIYNYDLSGSATSGTFYVKIYLIGLNDNKEYAFGDFVITGDMKNTVGATGEGVTLPWQSLKDVGTVPFTPSSALEVAAGEGYDEDDEDKKNLKLSFYVNESDATYTTTENQLSLRFKIQRQNGSDWYDDEIRYGVTIPYINGQTGGDGFNVIRRNDWIHIPIYITDWQLRIEPLAFVPIAGYPAKTVSSDGLTATFSTGGMIALQPFVKKYNDNTWRDFGDPEVTFVSVSWTNSDGTNVSGNGKIVKTAFAFDNVTHCLIGELNNDLSSGPHKTTFTVKVKLGSTGSQLDYSFTFNVILDTTN